MIYYILLPGDTAQDSLYDNNQLGESNDFGSFYPASGLSALMNIVQNSPELLPNLRIIKDNGQHITVERFLTEISKLKIMTNRFS